MMTSKVPLETIIEEEKNDLQPNFNSYLTGLIRAGRYNFYAKKISSRNDITHANINFSIRKNFITAKVRPIYSRLENLISKIKYLSFLDEEKNYVHILLSLENMINAAIELKKLVEITLNQKVNSLNKRTVLVLNPLINDLDSLIEQITALLKQKKDAWIPFLSSLESQTRESIKNITTANMWEQKISLGRFISNFTQVVVELIKPTDYFSSIVLEVQSYKNKDRLKSLFETKMKETIEKKYVQEIKDSVKFAVSKYITVNNLENKTSCGFFGIFHFHNYNGKKNAEKIAKEIDAMHSLAEMDQYIGNYFKNGRGNNYDLSFKTILRLELYRRQTPIEVRRRNYSIIVAGGIS